MRYLAGLVFLGALLAPTLTAAEPPDDALVRGIQQVDDGEYDGAILTLDNAARRLAADPKKVRELSQAYLYLGIAYVGKGHEAAAKAKFREAIAQMKDLTLSPEKFPPKVINLFEAARAEEPRAAAPAPAVKKGGKTTLVLVGVGAAAAVGVAVAAGGGGESGGSASTPSGGSTATTVTETFSGLLTQSSSAALIDVGPATTAGQWHAELLWTGTGADIHMFAVRTDSGEGQGEARLLTANSQVIDWIGVANVRYRVEIFFQEGGPESTNYELRVTRPR